MQLVVQIHLKFRRKGYMLQVSFYQKLHFVPPSLKNKTEKKTFFHFPLCLQSFLSLKLKNFAPARSCSKLCDFFVYLIFFKRNWKHLYQLLTSAMSALSLLVCVHYKPNSLSHHSHSLPVWVYDEQQTSHVCHSRNWRSRLTDTLSVLDCTCFGW